MGDEDEEFAVEDEVDGIDLHAYRWTKEHAVVDLLAYAAAMQRVTAEYLEQAAYRAAADSNKAVNDRIMHEEAALEIETLTEAPKGD